MFSERLFGGLLSLYAPRFREAFGAEMEQVFAEAAAERRSKGTVALARFALRELAGLCAGNIHDRLRSMALKDSPAALAESHVTFCGSAMRGASDAIQLAEAERRRKTAVNQMVAAIAGHRFVDARYYAKQEQELSSKVAELRGSSELQPPA